MVTVRLNSSGTYQTISKKNSTPALIKHFRGVGSMTITGKEKKKIKKEKREKNLNYIGNRLMACQPNSEHGPEFYKC